MQGLDFLKSGFSGKEILFPTKILMFNTVKKIRAYGSILKGPEHSGPNPAKYLSTRLTVMGLLTILKLSICLKKLLDWGQSIQHCT